MKKGVWVLPVITVIVFAIMVCVIGCGKKVEDTIYTGAIIPLTGDNAEYGKALKNGMDIALSQINKDWLDKHKSLRIVYEDSKADPLVGVSAFKKLVEINKTPMVIGGMFSSVSLAIAPIAQTAKVVTLSPTSSSVDLTNAGQWFFRIYPSDTYDGKFLADFTHRKLNAKKVAILYLQLSSTTAIAKVFESEFTSLGGDVLLSEGHLKGTTDFRSTLTKLKGIGADIVFIPGYLNEMALILKQAKELGLDTQFVSISTFNDSKIIELAGDAAENVIFSTPSYDPSSSAKLTRTFVELYRNKYGDIPNIWAGYGYDVVRVAAKAIEMSNNKNDSNAIREALSLIADYPGVTGMVTFDLNGDVKKELDVLVVKNRKFVSYE